MGSFLCQITKFDKYFFLQGESLKPQNRGVVKETSGSGCVYARVIFCFCFLFGVGGGVVVRGQSVSVSLLT